MARFYFNVENGRCYPDEEGAELADIEAARTEAVKVLAQTVMARPQDFWSTEYARVTVCDRGGLDLFCVTLLSTDAPSLRRL